MRTYFFLLMLSTLLSFGLTRWLAQLATARGWTRSDSSDTAGVPRLGGVSVFATTMFMMVLLVLWDNQVATRMMADLRLVIGLTVAASVVFLTGLYDDLRGAKPWQKLLVQSVAAVGLYLAGFRIEILTNPFTQGAIHLSWMSLPLTLLWLVAISNAFNLIDGLDGLAAGVGLFATVTLFLLAMLQAKSFAAAITVALAIDSSQKGPVLLTVAIPLMIFGLPLLDVSVTTARRFLSGQPLFHRDEEHLHHRLQKIGMTPRASVLLLYGLAALFALASLLLVNYKGASAPLIALLCGLLAWIVVRQMQYAEFAELDSHVRSEWNSQRHVLRNQILLRKAVGQLQATSSIEEAWGVARRILEALEFSSATCELKGRGALGWNAGAAEPEVEAWTLTIPLTHEDRSIGTLRLTRAMHQGLLLFRISPLMQFFAHDFAAKLAQISGEEPEQQLFRAAAGR